MILLVGTWVSNRLEREAARASALAQGHAERVKEQSAEAELQLKESNYNLARVFEEKATAALEENSFEEAWLYTLVALSHEIPDGEVLETSLGRVADPTIARGALGGERARSWCSRYSVQNPMGRSSCLGQEFAGIRLLRVQQRAASGI